MAIATAEKPQTEPTPAATKKNEVAAQTVKPEALAVHDNSSFANLLDTARFEHLWRVAKLFSQSKLVPVHFQGKVEDCFVACQMAMRLDVDPFMFMQNTYVISGKPGMEAKLAIALVNARGPFTGPIQFKLEGDKIEARRCTAYATHRATNQRCEAVVTYSMAKAEGWVKNPKWQALTDLMLQYRAATFLARLYAPECLMGMQTADEVEDVSGDLTRNADGSYGAPPRPVRGQFAEMTSANEPMADAAGDPEPASDDPVPTDWPAWADAFLEEVEACSIVVDVLALQKKHREDLEGMRAQAPEIFANCNGAIQNRIAELKGAK